MSDHEQTEAVATPVRLRPPLRRWLEVGVMVGVPILLVIFLLPAVQQAREAARRSQSRNNLKQIGLALHNYQDTYSRLPPGATVTPEGTAHHGWMTQILPYLDCSPVYNSIDLKRPWNDPPNALYLRTPYPVYVACYSDQVWTTDGWPLTHYQGNPDLFYRNSSLSIKDIDDKSSLWCVGEIKEGFKPWAYPFNWRGFASDSDFLRQRFGRGLNTGGHLLMLDGSVRWGDTSQSPSLIHETAQRSLLVRQKRGAPSEADISQPDVRFEGTHVDPKNPRPVYEDFKSRLRDARRGKSRCLLPLRGEANDGIAANAVPA